MKKSGTCLKISVLLVFFCLLSQQRAGTTANQALPAQIQLSAPASNPVLNDRGTGSQPLAAVRSLAGYIQEKFSVPEVMDAFKYSGEVELEKTVAGVKVKEGPLGSAKARPAHNPEERKALESLAAGENVKKAGLPAFTLGDELAAGYSIDYKGKVLKVRQVLKGGNPSRAIIEGGAVVYPDAHEDTSVLYVLSPGRCQEMLLLASEKAPREFEYEYSEEVELNEKGELTVSGLTLSRPVIFDSSGRRVDGYYRKTAPRRVLLSFNTAGLVYPLLIDPTWQASAGSMIAARYIHTATLLPNGKVLITGGRDAVGSLLSAELYDPATGTFSATGSMSTARRFHTATLLPNGKVLVVGGTNGTDLSSAEIYDPAAGTFSATGSMSSARSGHIAILLPNGKVLMAGGYSGSTYNSSAELYDPAAGTFAATGSMSVGRGQCSATLLPNGKVLVAGGDSTGATITASADLYDPAAGTFSATGPMGVARFRQSATLLPNGKVLIAGGANSGGTLSSAELYDPAAGTFSATGSMGGIRQGPMAVLLPNGKVLVTGGANASAGLSSSELYDPAAGTFSAGSSMSDFRSSPTATLLPNGKVLVTGGHNGSAAVASADLYILSEGNGTFSATGSMSAARWRNGAALLPNGKVLVIGGAHNGTTLSSAELYDPAAGTFSATGSMSGLRQVPATTLLPNGRVLVAGGSNASTAVSLVEIYDPASGTFSATGSLSEARSSNSSTLLPNGKVLVAGGHNGTAGVSSAEIYDPAAGTFSATGSMTSARYVHSATLLPNGKVLIVGGINAGVPTSSAELYDPATGTFSVTGSLNAGRAFHTATLLPNGKVLLAGGTNGSAPISSAELYDPAAGTFSATGPMVAVREGHVAVMLPSGKVLLAGGGGGSGSTAVSSAELYDPAAGTFSATGSMSALRQQYAAVMLPNGKALLVGGTPDGTAGLSSADLYDTMFDTGTTPPVLAWTGEANYTADGLDPETGDDTTNFLFRVKYTDADNDAPLSGYPKVYIKKGGTEISGSPFAMTFVSGAYSAGAIYTYSKILSSGTDYTYYFEARDVNSAVATGAPISATNAPDVTPGNTAPALAWTSEADYVSDGLGLENGVSTTTFVYRVKYTDADNDAPLSGYPKVHIKKGGAEISGSPFTMSFVSGANNTGAIYTYTKTLATIGTDYTYYFEAQDANSAAATGVPASAVDAPDVTAGNTAPALAWTSEADYVSDGLGLETGDMAASYIYRVKYTDADNDAPLSGYPKVHIKKGGTEISGSPFSMTFVSGANNAGAIYTYPKTLNTSGADYAYYFEAQDINTAFATGAPTSSIDAPDVSAIEQEGHKTSLGDNLFDPRTGGTSKIKFTVPRAGRVSLKIYDLAGKPIRTLYEGDVNSGEAQRDWDGKDDSGRYVVPSVYFLHYVYPGGKEVRKIGVKR